MLNKVDEAIHAVSDHLKYLAESDVEQEFSRTEAITKETEALEKLVASRAEFYKARYPKTEEDVALLRSVILEGCNMLDFMEDRDISLKMQSATHEWLVFKYDIINSFKDVLRKLSVEADVDIKTRTYLESDSKPSDSEKALAEEQEQNTKAKSQTKKESQHKEEPEPEVEQPMEEGMQQVMELEACAEKCKDILKDIGKIKKKNHQARNLSTVALILSIAAVIIRILLLANK